jgi:hypothetical protein
MVALYIADFVRRYMLSDRPLASLLGFGSHLAPSSVLRPVNEAGAFRSNRRAAGVTQNPGT